jgi:flagellar biosynthetic protein FliR
VGLLLLVLLRCTGFVVAAPLTGQRRLPAPVVAGLAAVLTVTFAPRVTVAASPVALWLAAPLELVVGLALGTIVGLGIRAVETVGHLLSLQLGLSLGAVFDPLHGEPATSLDPLVDLLAGLVFLALNLHLAAIAALADSFVRLPLGGGWPTDLALYTATLAGLSVELGARVALPLALVLLLVELAVSLVARAIPQVNVFFLGLPLKILVGLVVLAAGLPTVVSGIGAVERSLVAAAGGRP